ncbi:hypothetical protein B0H14DRAFT_3876786 [Mycena olivaceomarginata]|nr:hypothetical protein B0H14DRAFT_3876786 [Mycena olivaceomarginata]
MIPKMLCVARRLLLWIEPLLYRRISLNCRSSENLRQYRPSARNKGQTAPVFVKATRILSLNLPRGFSAHLTEAEVHKVINVCTAIVEVDLHGDALHLISHLRPQSMTLAATIARPHLDFSLPFFRIITHLHLQEPMGQGALRPDWPPIWELPALTHLVLSSGYFPETIHTYLAKCEKLLVIVLVWLLIPPPFYDSRVVSTASTPCCDDHEFWHRVEEFMKKKRRGEIEGSSHTLDPHHEIIFCAPLSTLGY